MAKRRTEVVAASVLNAWTDADTAMQIVGASLGVFGAGELDPDVVLATETPLRNALFDVLLSLVEGGALEIRTTDARRYAFRWREDIAEAGLALGESTTIDLAVPSPYLAELERAHAERDLALERAAVAEALAAEREQRLARIRVEPPAEAPAPKAAPRKAAVKKAAPKKVAPPKPEAETAPKPARTPARAKAPAPKKTEAGDVVYLTPPAADAEPDIDLTADAPAPRSRWAGYALEKGRKRLAAEK